MPEDSIFGLPFLELLEGVPEAAFFSQPDLFGTSPRARQFFRGQFRNVHNQFLGALGAQLRQGASPDLRFTDFLNQPNFFQQQYRSQPPALRGKSSSRFAPPTRFDFGL